jgi:predicted metal-binding membrane protein
MREIAGGVTGSAAGGAGAGRHELAMLIEACRARLDAMMLPSLAPTAVVYATLTRRREPSGWLLSRCRTPRQLLGGRWREGRAGAGTRDGRSQRPLVYRVLVGR